jgi:hypothetical protein
MHHARLSGHGGLSTTRDGVWRIREARGACGCGGASDAGVARGCGLDATALGGRSALGLQSEGSVGVEVRESTAQSPGLFFTEDFWLRLPHHPPSLHGLKVVSSERDNKAGGE